ncbi:nuclear transcription factor Y subunit B-1-like [Prunus avium]|uniref:Nuclear transcription factor Y subunit B-1-like n=1 Tax=Prunus avium TaxID=42229 RepID=A0A6P5RC18_PRUAV|nr:nuclear transcription factor Y subunit B-1-like [Prunus avium]
MSGRRSQTSPVGSPLSGNVSDSSSKEQDRFLPIANVSRIMKKSLPANAKISKEAKETVQECVSEFISFITGEASDKCQREKRKTINGDDLLWAMTTLGFENYVGPLKGYLNKYRETEGEKNSMARQEDPSQQQEHHHNTSNPNLQHGSNNDQMNTVLNANNISMSISKVDLFNGGFYSLGGQQQQQQVTQNYNLVSAGAYNLSRIHEGGDGNGNRDLATHHLHNGIGW